MRVTTAEHIIRMFSKFDYRMSFSDSPSGFYGVFGGMFDTLAREEELAREWEGLEPSTYPSFGYADDDYEVAVRPFYSAWSSFATSKTFSWKDKYRLSDAPDRRVRRMMEKENKRFREDAIHEFNDSVRSLVAFVRKRDPRYKLNSQNEVDRQRTLRNAAAAQASRSRAANQAKMDNYKAPEWVNLGEPDETDVTDNEQDPIEELECIVCKKDFKSENQYEAHEKSKKHIKAVQQFRRKMQNEDKELNVRNHDNRNYGEEMIDAEISIAPSRASIEPSPCHPGESDYRGLPKETSSSKGSRKVAEATASFGADAPLSSDIAIGENCSVLRSEDDENSSRESSIGESDVEAIQKQSPSMRVEQTLRELSAESSAPEPSLKVKPKIGKAKEKRARKAARSGSKNSAQVSTWSHTSFSIIHISSLSCLAYLHRMQRNISI